MSHAMKKSNPFQVEPFSRDAVRDRLRDIRIGEHERLIAEAHLARAEAIADLLARAIESVRSATRALLSRPWQRIAAAIR
jgi:hypothetical protein